MNHGEPPTDPPEDNAIRRGIRVLLVDDNPHLAEIVREILAELQCELIASRNPLIAVDLFLDERPDLVLLDYRMPEMNGLELCQALRTLDPDCPMIMLTVFDDRRLLAQAKAAGIDVFLAKPFRSRELVDAVRGLLARTPSAHVVPI